MKKVFLCGIGLLIVKALGAACECTPLEDEKTALAQADYAFTGEVINLQTNWISGGWKYTFKVKESWKKKVASVLVINTAWAKDCGYEFQKGKAYLVFVNRKFIPKTQQCMGNKQLGENPLLGIEELGNPYQPGEASMPIYMYALLTILGLSSIVFMGWVVLRKRHPHKDI